MHVCMDIRSKLARFDTRMPIPGSGAYITLENTSGSPIAVWHDGSTTHLEESFSSIKNLGKCKTAFSIPDFSVHAPIVFVSTSQVGFKVDRIRFEAYRDNVELLAQEDVLISSDNDSVDLQEVFAKYKISGLVSVVATFSRDLSEFKSMPACYLHLFYRSGSMYGDQVHSHFTVGYKNDPFPRFGSYRCRKSAPFINDDRLSFIYSIVNVGGIGPNPDNLIKVRILTDTGAERVVHHTLPENGIYHIFGHEILKAIEHEIKRAAIVQLEHETTNFNASWFVLENKSNHLGVDHFSGA